MIKLSGLSLFFPFLNDEGTVQRQIESAFVTGRRCAHEIEVIAILGGKSRDNTKKKLVQMQKQFPQLLIIDKEDNTEGYAVIKYGIQRATKEWIFYTDGDAQYHLEEDLPRLITKQQQTGADVVNGYKRLRHDNRARIVLGNLYSKVSRLIFQLPIRDTDCDFRLMRKKLCDQLHLESSGSSILPEMIVKFCALKATFAEVAVQHYPREYGVSNYTAYSLLKEKVIGDVGLFLKLWMSRCNLPIRKVSS